MILANSEAGVLITGSTATNNMVQGNSIGARTTGGQALGNGSAGLTIGNAGSAIIGGTVAGAGNVISGNSQGGIFMTNSTGVVVQGNRIGIDSTGTLALSNAISGITIAGGSSNLIGGTASGAGNVISGNLGSGIWLMAGAEGNLIQGNYIGTDASGVKAVSNTRAGLLIESAGNTVGGLGEGARNVISGNGLDGVWLATTSATSNLVAGNFIGTDATGAGALGNGRAGVGISNAPGNTIGDASEGAGNVISANSIYGIYLFASGAAGNVIQGNKVGTDVSGLTGLGNLYEGIHVESASTNTFGGVSPGAGNLISANGLQGLLLTNASWNVVQGNWIGVSSDGISGLGNAEFGVECQVGANHNLIGGTAPGAANRIAYSQTIPGMGSYAGVRIRDGAANNAILGNSIFANAGLGIDLGPYGVNLPVPCDDVTSASANLGQNYPVLTQAVSGPCGTGIGGTLNSRPNAVYLPRVFCRRNAGHFRLWPGTGLAGRQNGRRGRRLQHRLCGTPHQPRARRLGRHRHGHRCRQQHLRILRRHPGAPGADAHDNESAGSRPAGAGLQSNRPHLDQHRGAGARGNRRPRPAGPVDRLDQCPGSDQQQPVGGGRHSFPGKPILSPEF